MLYPLLSIRILYAKEDKKSRNIFYLLVMMFAFSGCSGEFFSHYYDPHDMCDNQERFKGSLNKEDMVRPKTKLPKWVERGAHFPDED